MKKYFAPAGILCTAAVAVAGTIAYRKLKKNPKEDIIFYPIGKYVIHTDSVHKTLESLMKEADLIVLGKVKSKSSPRWNNRENKQPKSVHANDMIYFDYLITPLTIYKGSVSDCTELRLRSTEGSIGGYALEDNSQPKFLEGQDLILLLKHGSNKDYRFDGQEFYTLCGNLDGVFYINGDKLEGQTRTYDKSTFETIVKSFVNP